MSVDSRPNILWITMEDTSPRLGCYGDSVAATPHIDRLAAEGCLYRHAYSTAAVCSPSRRSVITGMYQTSVGSPHHRLATSIAFAPEMAGPYEAVLPPYVKVFSEYMRHAGYYCTNNAKTDYQFHCPITAWDDCGKQAHWKNRESGQPFFAVFNIDVTHESGMWPKKQGGNPNTNPADVVIPPYLPDTPVIRKTLAQHYDNLALSDRRIGFLLQELADAGEDRNTIVFLWSDHGEGIPRGKSWLYDGGIHVPLIVRWPGVVEEGTISDQMVSMVDLAPTVLSLAGIEIPQHMQGLPFIGSDRQERSYIYAARDRHDEMYDMVRTVRGKRYKYIRNFHPELPYSIWNQYRNRHPMMQELLRLYLEGELHGDEDFLFRENRPVEELYDCELDPYELHNEAANPALKDVLVELRSELDRWRNHFGDIGDLPEDLIANTMWPGGVQPITAAPLFVPISKSGPGIEPSNGGTLEGSAVLQLHCATQGASMVYTTDTAEPVKWKLYKGPVRLSPGETTLTAQAARIGYRDSDMRSATFVVG